MTCYIRHVLCSCSRYSTLQRWLNWSVWWWANSFETLGTSQGSHKNLTKQFQDFSRIIPGQNTYFPGPDMSLNYHFTPSAQGRIQLFIKGVVAEGILPVGGSGIFFESRCSLLQSKALYGLNSRRWNDEFYMQNFQSSHHDTYKLSSPHYNNKFPWIHTKENILWSFLSSWSASEFTYRD